jgi:endonuclease/exonuclease/phosphatase family metal-dependent hydrolase
MKRGVLLLVLVAACAGSSAQPDAGHFDPVTSGCDPQADPGQQLPDELFEYAWACSRAVPSTGITASADPGDADCSAGTWPDLAVTSICPTPSDTTRADPASGLTLPPSDDRGLPVDVGVQESGSFIAEPLASYPARLKVVEWNVEFTAGLDRQIEELTTNPMLADADVYLLGEVDRCTTRNGNRRAARLLAQAIGGDYVYGVEFVELDIGRTVGGDTGQAIVSRRPLTGASVTCHSRQYDWFASDDEPRLGQRVTLSADVPAGSTQVRVHAIHFESNDVLGDKRVVQVKEMLDRAQRDACDRPQVVAGDFNTWYCGAPELEVLRRSGFVDATRSAGDIEPTHDNGLRLDYIWAQGLRVVDAGVVRGLGASDHAPTWAVLEVE